MKNKVIFTQDIDGERQWLSEKFPTYKNLETVHSGQWPELDPDTVSDQGALLEIPYSDNPDPGKLYNTETYVSLFDSTKPQIGWLCADSILINQPFPQFEDKIRNYAHAVTFGRVGTVFVESLLYKHYKKLVLNDEEIVHFTSGTDSENQKVFDIIDSFENLHLVFVYRKDWWAWLTSTVIADAYGYYHERDNIDWSAAKPLSVSISDLLELEKRYISTWNFFFELRKKYPTHSFYLLEFSNMLQKYAQHTSHKAMPYDKRKLISNYDEIKNIFERDFLTRWQIWERRAVDHLLKMSCKPNLDNLF